MTTLDLQLTQINNKTEVKKAYFTSPLKLGYPSVDSYSRLKIVFMMASAGMLKGDSHNYNIFCEEATRAIITDQSYCKIFNTEDGLAKRKVNVVLENDASLIYRPQSVIPFKESTYCGNATFTLKENSELAYFDIFVSGRVGMGESFEFNKYSNRIQVNLGEKPVWIDNCSLCPSRQKVLDGFYFDNHTHMGTFYYYGKSEVVEQLSNYICENKNIYSGVSLAAHGITIRFLGYSSQDIEEEFDKLQSYIG